MDWDDIKPLLWIIGGILALVGICIALGSALSWRTACVQSAVWHRQGIEMSPREIWWGATPSEQIIRLKTKGNE